jgi:hypothetical protein
VLTTIDGVAFDEAWERSSTSVYGGVPIRLLSLIDLITNKRAVGRPQDLLDVQKLEAALSAAK